MPLPPTLQIQLECQRASTRTESSSSSSQHFSGAKARTWVRALLVLLPFQSLKEVKQHFSEPKSYGEGAHVDQDRHMGLWETCVYLNPKPALPPFEPRSLLSHLFTNIFRSDHSSPALLYMHHANPSARSHLSRLGTLRDPPVTPLPICTDCAALERARQLAPSFRIVVGDGTDAVDNLRSREGLDVPA